MLVCGEGWYAHGCLVKCRAENGCFIKPLPDRDGNAPWINVVANFNLTWKAACIELLQYVCLVLFPC